MKEGFECWLMTGSVISDRLFLGQPTSNSLIPQLLPQRSFIYNLLLNFKQESLLAFTSRLLFATRQRPTFPRPRGSSIIGLGGLNFRVRDGNGWGPSGKATGNIEYVLIVRVLPELFEV